MADHQTTTDPTWWVVGSLGVAAGLGGLYYWKTHRGATTPTYIQIGGSGPGPTRAPTKTTSEAYRYHYTVQSGDTLSGIAFCTGSSVSQLQSLNHIANVNAIDIGQVLIVPHPCSGASGASESDGSTGQAQLVIMGAQVAGGA